MLLHRRLVDTPDLRITEVICDGHRVGWSAPEPVTTPAIVLARRGVFRRRVGNTETLVDPATGYLQLPGTEQEIAHPAGGDVCTAITLPAADDLPDHAGPVDLTPRLAVLHRLLVGRAAARRGDVAVTDLAMEVAAVVLRGGPERDGSRRTQRRLADGAKEILWAEPGCPLPLIARRLHVSPWHLSRVFHQATGTTLSRYRLRVRAVAALDRLAVTGTNLAALATELGFADQAHLTRTLRAETGQPPGLLRTLLSQAG